MQARECARLRSVFCAVVTSASRPRARSLVIETQSHMSAACIAVQALLSSHYKNNLIFSSLTRLPSSMRT